MSNNQFQETVQSGEVFLKRMETLCSTLSAYAPDPDSIRNPEKAIKAVDEQLGWLVSSHQRVILDHNDSIRRHLLFAIRSAGLHKKEVSFPDFVRRSQQGSSPGIETRTMTLETLINSAITEIRRTTLTQTNVWNRGIMYMSRIWLTGGEIPSFPYLEEGDARPPAKQIPDFVKPPKAGS